MRGQLIERRLRRAGWIDSLITRERFYRRDKCYATGRIYLVGYEDGTYRHPLRSRPRCWRGNGRSLASSRSCTQGYGM
jgi:hypothetical protein